MISHSPLRHVHLFRFRMRFILLTGLISALGSALVGLLAPYLYTSNAVIQYEQPRSRDDLGLGDDGVAFHKASLLIQSPQILSRVADELSRELIDERFYFPRALSVFDFTARFSLMLRHLGYRPPEDAVRSGHHISPDVITSFLGQHVKVATDYRIHTITVSYEAGNPQIAARICQLIVDSFIEMSNEMQKDELRRQEKYLLDAIDRQLANIRRLEREMQTIVEAHPSMTSAQRDQGRGATMAAERLLLKRTRLHQIDQDLRANEVVLSSIRRDLASVNKLRSNVTSDVTQKLIEEISQLEFRRLQSIKVTGYEEDSPQVQSLTRRINDLKRALTNISSDGRAPQSREGASAELGDLRTLYNQSTDLKAKNRNLQAERTALLKDIEEEETSFRSAVKINFQFDALVRELQSALNVTNELYRDLQRTRLEMAGTRATASLISPPSYNPYSVNLSIRRRTIFGIFVGIAFALSLLILYEIIRPTLLIAEDLENIGLNHLGTFRLKNRSLTQLAYCLRSLNPSREREGGGQVVSFLANSHSTDMSELVSGVAKALAEKGAKVGAVLLVDPDATETAEWESKWTDKKVGVSWISRDEVPYFFGPTVEELRSQWEWILVVDTKPNQVPLQSYLSKHSDHFIYVCEIGDTDLTSVDRIRHIPQLPTHLQHHSLVVDVPLVPRSMLVWKRNRDEAA